VDPETLYRQVGRLLEEVPDFPAYGNLTPDQLKWLGRARALVKETGDLTLITDFEPIANAMQGPMRADAQQLLLRNIYSWRCSSCSNH